MELAASSHCSWQAIWHHPHPRHFRFSMASTPSQCWVSRSIPALSEPPFSSSPSLQLRQLRLQQRAQSRYCGPQAVTRAPKIVKSSACRKGEIITSEWPRRPQNSHLSLGKRMIARQDDFDVDDFEGYEGEDEMGTEMEDEEQEGDMEVEVETEYDMPEGSFSVRDSEVGEGENPQWVEVEEVDYKIDRSQFHKIKLHACDFFVRMVEDPDNDVYNFQEMYVTAPDTEVYAVPKIFGSMPAKPLRCMRGEWKLLLTKALPPSGAPRAPMAVCLDEVAKVFLIKHLDNLRDTEEDFVLDFEEIYVLDGADRSIRRADVKVEVPGGSGRDRNNETLVVRDNGTSFSIIPEEKRRTPDEIIEEYQWNKSRTALDGFLRGYRDYEKSNWF